MKIFMLSLIAAFSVFTMSSAQAAGRPITIKYLHPVAAVTADSLSSAIDLAEYDGNITIVVDVGAAGSGNTIDLKLVQSDTSGGSYTDVTGGGFTQVGNAASQQSITINKNGMKRYVKLNKDITTGSTISVLVESTILGYKKYN